MAYCAVNSLVEKRILLTSSLHMGDIQQVAKDYKKYGRHCITKVFFKF